MAANAIKTQGTKFEINTTGSTYVPVKGFRGFTGLGGGSASVIDVTDMDSTAKEKIMGLQDEGQINVDFLYLPKDAGQILVRAARTGSSVLKVRITLADGTTFAFSSYVLSFEKSVGADDVVTSSSTLEITGPVTETAAP